MPRMMGRLARSSLATTAILGMRLVTQATFLVVVTRLLGPSAYGDYMAAASLAVIAGLIPSLGSGYVLMARAAHEGTNAVETWRYAWPLTLILGILLCIGFPWAAELVTKDTLSTVSLLLIGITELVMTPCTQLLGFVLQALNRVPTGQFLLWFAIFLRALAAAACLTQTTGSTVAGFLFLQTIAAAAGLGAALIVSLRIVSLPWKPRLPTRDEWRSGGAYAAMHIVAANPSELDKIAAPTLLGDHAAGIYGASSRILGALVTPVVGVLIASQPRLFRHGVVPTPQGARLVQTLSYAGAAWGCISALLLVSSAPLLPYLLGDSFRATKEALPWIALAAPFIALRMTAGTILVALGKPLQRLRFELAGVVLLAAFLVAGSHLFGLRGMALGLASAEACMAAYGWLLVRAARS